MRPSNALPLLLFVCICLSGTPTLDAQEAATVEVEAPKKPKIETVKFPIEGGNLVLNVPTTWKKMPNANRMRKGTFEIPPAKGDKEPGELTIFNFPGNQVDPNMKRWIGQFSSDGRKSKMVQGKAGKYEYYMVDISGTYNKSVGPPIARKTKPFSNYRMLGVIMPIPGKGMYFLKLAGPDKTIAGELDNLRNSFNGEKEAEKPYEM